MSLLQPRGRDYSMLQTSGLLTLSRLADTLVQREEIGAPISDQASPGLPLEVVVDDDCEESEAEPAVGHVL